VQLLSALSLQQLYSHGTYAFEVWTTERRLDVASMIVLFGLPPLLIAIALEAQADRRRMSRTA
jgi:hypothetical protein